MPEYEKWTGREIEAFQMKEGNYQIRDEDGKIHHMAKVKFESLFKRQGYQTRKSREEK